MKHINIKKIKMIFLICITLVVILSAFSKCYADSIFISGSASDYIGDPSNDPTANEIVSKVLGIIQVIGAGLAVGIIMILGIRYMMGSVEEKVNYKETMPPLLIGAILLGAAPTVVRIIYSMTQQIGG